MAAMQPVEQPARRSHSIAIEGFNGQMEIVQADELRVCVPTRECIQFWATIIACIVVIALGVFFTIYQGPTSPYYSFGLSMIGLGSGVLIPGALPLFRYPNNVQQVQITESWRRQRRTDASPQIEVRADAIQTNTCQIVIPSASRRSPSYLELARFQ